MIIMQRTHKPTVLAIGAHPDDVELGCGGFISRFVLDCRAKVHVAIMTYGTHHWQKGKVFQEDERAKEALRAVRILLGIATDRAAQKYLHLGGFKDCELANAGHALVAFVEDLIDLTRPDIILTHAPRDLHDDHRQTHHATLSAARGLHGTILFYQTASTIPNQFTPTFFVQLCQDEFDKKMLALEAHSSQRGKDFMSHTQITKIAEAWAGFHHMDGDTKLEAFALYQSFWK
ncbi:MAG: PIG-L deacetylase family protein [Planctomycetota bacterium]|jgi:LmbE family N-acetylglucosaminyl deacetylase